MNDSQMIVGKAGVGLDNVPSNNIALGYMAGYDITTERLQLCIKLDGLEEVRTTMTQEEYEVVYAIVQRLFRLGLME